MTKLKFYKKKITSSNILFSRIGMTQKNTNISSFLKLYFIIYHFVIINNIVKNDVIVLNFCMCQYFVLCT